MKISAKQQNFQVLICILTEYCNQNETGTYVSYQKAWKAREIALDYMRGEPDDSYQELPAFLNMVTKTNPGSRIDVKTDSENRFLYMFMAFGASIQG